MVFVFLYLRIKRNNEHITLQMVNDMQNTVTKRQLLAWVLDARSYASWSSIYVLDPKQSLVSEG